MESPSPSVFCLTHSQQEPCTVCAEDRQQPSSLEGKSRLPMFTDRDLAIAVRAALLAIVDALEKRYYLKKKKS